MSDARLDAGADTATNAGRDAARSTSTGAVRVAIVTGAGTGIGRAVALALAADGFTVVLAGRRREPLDVVATEAVAAGAPSVSAIPTDVTDEASVDSLFADTVSRFGRVDLLFNNAGSGARPVAVEELTVDEWRAVVDVNLTGSFLCARAAFRQMKAQSPAGGRIVNNGSISAHTPRPFSAPYTATKHAITGLTKALALDGRAHGITVGQIDIGNAATPMTARMANGVLQPDGSSRVEPTFDVAEVGRAVSYMASLPPDANVLFLTVMANEMPFLGRG